MTPKPADHFDERALVKGTMLRAHLSWATNRFGPGWEPVRERLSPPALALLSRSILATDWIPFALLVEIDRALAAAAGGDPEETWLALGRHSAALNLTGVYKSFISGEPHRFFERMAVLHHQFQTFGRSVYEKLGESSGRIRIENSTAYSQVYCISGRGYYEEALRLLRAPGPISVRETACSVSGDPACVFELSW
jgi:predicted hydrocarbon binding protein